MQSHADGAKLFAVVNTANDASIVQQDLTRVDKWSVVWQIKLNYKKCNHMHLGKHQNIQQIFHVCKWGTNRNK